MKISKKIIDNLKKGGVDFYLSVPCKLLANMIDILEYQSCWLITYMEHLNKNLLHLFLNYR